MEPLIRCLRCGRSYPASTNTTFGGSCPYCLLMFALADDEPLSDDLADDGTTDPAASPNRLGPYLVLETLGVGGMGSVYKARHESLERIVALKVLKPEFARRPGFPERFQREGQLLATLSHPGITGVHDLGCDCGAYYLAMEFVEGMTLREHLKEGSLPPDEAKTIFTQMCDALQYAHDRGIVHRDIKPENVLIDAQGRVKIADFGIAKLLGEGLASPVAPTEANTLVGTRGYMAPEQLEPGRSVDQRADLYSLAVVFYEMLTGELPLGVFAPPSAKAAVNWRVDKCILAALAKDPSDRPADANAFRTRIEQALTHNRTSDQIDWIWGTMMPYIAAIGTVGLVLTPLTLMLANWYRSSQREPVPLAQGEPQPENPALIKSDIKPLAKPPVKSEEKRAMVFAHGARVWDVAFAPRESLLASAGEDGLVKFWKATGVEPIATLPAYPHGELGYLRLAFSPTSSQLATAGGENVARLWKWPSSESTASKQEEPLVLSGHGREIVGLAYSPDGMRLATASHDRAVKLWNTSDGKLVATWSDFTDPVLCVSFSPDGKTIAAGVMTGAIKFWDVESQATIGTSGHSKRVWSLAFFPNGDWVASGSHDQSVKLTDWKAKKVIETFSAKGTEVWSIAVSSDGQRLAAGSHDGFLRIWSVTDRATLAQTKAHAGPIVSLKFSGDGQQIATASLDQTAKLWDIEPLLLKK